MPRDYTLTERYLERIGGRILGPVTKSELGRAFYGEAYAPRPVFLSADEIHQLNRDLEVLRAALFRLPHLLFDGNLAAFARANGMKEAQVRAIERSSAGVSNTLTSMGRADIYNDQSGFRILEFNMGGAIGFDSGDICRGFLEDPEFAQFASDEGLQYIDTLTEQVHTFRSEMELTPADRPIVAHVEWPTHFAKNEPYMSAICKRWGDYGLEAYPCHVGQLERRDGRLWLAGRPVDIVYRQFLMDDLLDDKVDVLLEPLLGALESGEVRMFTSLESELYGSKASLAMLSNRAHRHLFSDEELDVIDRLLPWTSSVTPEVTLEDGTKISLLDHAMADQHELILKPTMLFGGRGVVPGWSSEVTPEDWRKLLLEAMDGPYVLQRRIHPVSESFPEPDGSSRPWIVSWGVVMMASGHGGFFTRCSPADQGNEVLNLFQGSLVGSGFSGPSSRT